MAKRAPKLFDIVNLFLHFFFFFQKRNKQCKCYYISEVNLSCSPACWIDAAFFAHLGGYRSQPLIPVADSAEFLDLWFLHLHLIFWRKIMGGLSQKYVALCSPFQNLCCNDVLLSLGNIPFSHFFSVVSSVPNTAPERFILVSSHNFLSVTFCSWRELLDFNVFVSKSISNVDRGRRTRLHAKRPQTTVLTLC